MRIVLFKSVDNLGSAGDVVDVKRGYYRNFLGPRGFAREATRANLALMESQKNKIQAMVQRERLAAGEAAEALQGVVLEFELRSNDKGQLFGSVTSMDIAKSLADKGLAIDRRKIEMPEAIKLLGTYPVRIRLYPEVFAEISITVKRLLTPEEIEHMKAEEERRERERAIAQSGSADHAETEEGEGGEAEEVLAEAGGEASEETADLPE